MSNVCVYSFADSTGNTKYVDDNDYNYTGTWSSAGTYFTSQLDVVTYATTLYMCIVDNIGDNPRRTPTRTNPTKWSVLSLLYEYQCTPTSGSDSTALEALALAQTGTEIAWAAYYLAQIGTNTGSAAYALAGSAATDASTALGVANSAFSIAVDGTNAAAAAQSTADAAYALAQIGTNTGTAALSAAGAAQSTANGAFAIAVAGTNAANEALDILSTRLNGTVSVWAAGSFGGPTSTQLTFINGVLAVITP